ncbi:hypothetical protein [Haloferula sp.]|uniref:hypothetical protein n=1 Tax=Haloferula sp. TaxID=2497595 RepID=UPI003C7332D2
MKTSIPLSKPRFEALLYRRSPFTWFLFRELEWWANEDESLIATITLDAMDDDYAYMVLGRDETGVFRGIANMVSFETKNAAREAMLAKMAELSASGDKEFPQGDNNRKKHEILVPCVPEEKLNPNFQILATSVAYSPAQGIVKELSFAFTDLDGNYRKDFQTTGFDGRLWELYLYAAFYEQRFHIDDQHSVPDFIIAKGELKIAVEAVTVNPTSDSTPPAPKTPAEELELCEDYMPIKWGSPLFSKLQKRYWEKEQVKGIPLVFAIHDFHGPGSMVWSLPALSDCVFGIRCGEDGKDYPVDFCNYGEKKNIPAGFFRQPDAENISAVIASNEATLTKFNRMGKIAGFGNPDVFIARAGAALDLETNECGEYRSITEIGKVTEIWSAGLWVFHNPNAKIPLAPEAFPNAINVFLDESGQRNYRSAQRFHVLRSVSQVIAPSDSK